MHDVYTMYYVLSSAVGATLRFFKVDETSSSSSSPSEAIHTTKSLSEKSAGFFTFTTINLNEKNPSDFLTALLCYKIRRIF